MEGGDGKSSEGRPAPLLSQGPSDRQIGRCGAAMADAACLVGHRAGPLALTHFLIPLSSSLHARLFQSFSILEEESNKREIYHAVIRSSSCHTTMPSCLPVCLSALGTWGFNMSVLLD
jgi:hypothetical protein